MNYKLIKKQDFTKKENFHQVLGIDGKLVKGVKDSPMSDKQMLEAYRWMMLQTRLDEKLSQMQRQGRMLTFVPNLGEVALQIAVGMAMDRKKDYFVPAFRSNLTMMYLGMTLEQSILYWNGNEMGSKFADDVNVLPVNIPIATQFSHAAGIGYALKLQNKKGVAVSFIGDGGTSEGEFYEAINMAAIHKWNTVFCINNNQWSISTPVHFQTAAETYASKAIALGLPAIRVDGNDPLASYEAMQEALDHARSGKGPILVEFLTYRQGPHSTSDSPRVYRTEEYEKEMLKKEPNARFRKFLKDKKLWDDKKEAKMIEEIDAQVMEAYNKSLSMLKEELDEVFDYTYATLTEELIEQKEEARELLAKGLIKNDY